MWGQPYLADSDNSANNDKYGGGYMVFPAFNLEAGDLWAAWKDAAQSLVYL